MAGAGRFCAVLGMAAVLGASVFAGSGGAATAKAVSGPMVSPYAEISAANLGNVDTAVSKDALKSFTAAFVLGSGCTPTWDNGTAVSGDPAADSAITTAQSGGATAIISFGGDPGTGTDHDLADTCTNAPNLTTAYQSLVLRYNITHVDFDVEGAALNDSAAIANRFAALAPLESEDPNLVLSFTLPVGPSGLLPNAVAFLTLAKKDGVRVDLVNIMTMNYGGAVSDMATTAESSAKGTLSQVRSLWPTTTYANIGITPMIGQNNSAGEIFTTADAKKLRKFAKSNGVGRLGFWSINRDQACPTPGGPAQSSCSSVAQKTLAFTKAFL